MHVTLQTASVLSRSSPQLPSDEDLVRVRVQHPVVTFPRVVVVSGYLEEEGWLDSNCDSSAVLELITWLTSKLFYFGGYSNNYIKEI